MTVHVIGRTLCCESDSSYTVFFFVLKILIPQMSKISSRNLKKCLTKYSRITLLTAALSSSSREMVLVDTVWKYTGGKSNYNSQKSDFQGEIKAVRMCVDVQHGQ